MNVLRSPSARAGANLAPWLLVALLIVLPFPSSVAIRNSLLAFALLAVAIRMANTSPGLHTALPPARVWLPMLLWSLWCIASVGWSLDRAYSASELRSGLLYPATAFFVFYVTTRDESCLDRWGGALTASLALLGLGAVVINLLTGARDVHRWHGGVGAFSTHVVLALPMLIWIFVRTPPRRRVTRWLIAGAGVLALTGLWLAASRIAWIALAVMTILGGFAWHRLDRKANGNHALLLLVVMPLLLLAMFTSTLQQRSPSRHKEPIDATLELAKDPRVALWRFSLAQIADAPWVGHGYGKNILQDRFVRNVFPYNPLNQHGHNIVLNVAMQTGLLGLALFIWMTVALVREMMMGLKGNAGERAVAALGLIILAGFAIRNMTDDFLVRHNALLAWSLAGAILGALRTTSARTPA